MTVERSPLAVFDCPPLTLAAYPLAIFPRPPVTLVLALESVLSVPATDRSSC